MSLLLSDTLISNNGFLLEFRAIIMTRQQALLTLGLNMSAREADIRTAWRKKAKFFHPDSPYADERGFFLAQEAYQTLIPPVPKAFRVQARSRSF
jgi:hypothetical protein